MSGLNLCFVDNKSFPESPALYMKMFYCCFCRLFSLKAFYDCTLIVDALFYNGSYFRNMCRCTVKCMVWRNLNKCNWKQLFALFLCAVVIILVFVFIMDPLLGLHILGNIQRWKHSVEINGNIWELIPFKCQFFFFKFWNWIYLPYHVWRQKHKPFTLSIHNCKWLNPSKINTIIKIICYELNFN